MGAPNALSEIQLNKLLTNKRKNEDWGFMKIKKVLDLHICQAMTRCLKVL